MEKEHADLSASGSSRWMNCPGSTVLEAGEPNEDNAYSTEGTLAHALAAHCFEKGIDADGVLFLDMPDRKTGKVVTTIVDMDMREYVQEYLDFVRERAVGHKLMVEQRLDMSWLTGEKDAKGTADTVLISKDGDTIRIFDLKYGFNEVDANDNSQLRIYGLCAADVFSAAGDFETYELGIFQPRIGNIDSEVITAEEMKAFEKKVRAAVARVREAQKSNSLDGFLKTGAHCKWCRAAAKCPKLTQEVKEATLIDFEDETQTELIDPVNLAKAGSKLALVEGWMRNVRAKIEAELFSGRDVKGWKLVEGKKGNRKFIDEETTINELAKLGVKKADITATKLLTPAQLEKKIKGNQAALDKLPALYSQAPGRPGVAPLSDKCAPYRLKPEDDFSEVYDDE